mgnify:CR=1 FL=1
MGLSIWQILLVVALVILLFGRGKISELMGDVAKGIKSFRKGLTEEDIAPGGDAGDGKTIEGKAASEADHAAHRETMKN